jgi:S-formylglutathione hydrolase
MRITYWIPVVMVVLAGWLAAQNGSAPAKGAVEKIVVHGASLEGNLEGDSPDRNVVVYLPPSYAAERNRRYPVIYLLHGYTDSEERWFGFVQHFINVPVLADKAIAAGVREMIIVMPNAYTKYQGSMYSNSAVTGDWEAYVSHDLVEYMDAHYRTIPDRMSRGLAGHSMGGYGTVRIGMKHPEVFSSMYALSPCCMTPNLPAENPNAAKAEAIRTIEEFNKADFGAKAILASAAVWSPNPKNPPFFFDLPYKNGSLRPDIAAKWYANSPLAMMDQYIPSFRKMTAIAVDAGNMDEPIASTVREMDARLTLYGIPHTAEIYEGNHVNHVGDRVEQKMLPFFAQHLRFNAGK